MLVDGVDPIGTVAIVLGVVLCVCAIAWRTVETWLVRKRIAEMLSSPDPDERCSAVAVATSQGLGRHARGLKMLIDHEADGRVLDALASAIARSLWEPADSQAIVDLRLWAEDRSRMGCDAATRELAAVVPVPAAPRRVRHGGGSPALSGAAGDRTSTVLVTGAGGPAGVNVVRALMAAGHVVVAIDADPLAAGLHLASRGEVVVTADHPDFVDQLIDLALVHHADALITTVAEEMSVLTGRPDVAQHVATWLPSERALADTMDKWRFACVMASAGISIPDTTLPEGTLVPGPWVVKPRRSRGSRDVRFVDRTDDLGAAIRMTPDPIVQTRVTGAEFTVDVLVDRGGEVAGAVPRWRLETKGGISTKGRTFCDARVIDAVTAVMSALRLEGAANVQGFVDGDRVTVVEVNPRFSGGLSLALAAGADLVGEYLRGIFALPIRAERLTFAPDTTMIRHFEEIYV
jgi:carbamoyl-phosphate synthase large subunit